MGWLLEIYVFFRDFDRNWGTPAARRRSLKDIAWIVAIMTFFGLIVLMITTIRMNS